MSARRHQSVSCFTTLGVGCGPSFPPLAGAGRRDRCILIRSMRPPEGPLAGSCHARPTRRHGRRCEAVGGSGRLRGEPITPNAQITTWLAEQVECNETFTPDHISKELVTTLSLLQQRSKHRLLAVARLGLVLEPPHVERWARQRTGTSLLLLLGPCVIHLTERFEGGGELSTAPRRNKFKTSHLS